MIVVGPFERLCLLEDLGDGMLGPKKGSLKMSFTWHGFSKENSNGLVHVCG